MFPVACIGRRRLAAAGGGGGVSYLLDDHPTDIYAGYSVRKLSSTYVGSCLRIREDGGDTEIDIGFDGDWVDDAAIAAHCGANNGYVVKWYDQSGNSRDVSHTTAAAQPLIYNGTSVLTASNGKPLVRFDGVDDNLYFSDPNAGANDHSDYMAVNNVTWQSGYRAFIGGGDLGAGQNFIIATGGSSANVAIRIYFQGTERSYSTGDAEDTEWIFSMRRNYSAATAQFIVNDSAEQSWATIGTVGIHEGVGLGRRFNYGGTYLTMDMQEFIRWHSNHSDEDDTAIRGNMNTALAYH